MVVCAVGGKLEWITDCGLWTVDCGELKSVVGK
jgi:hypothetical protein